MPIVSLATTPTKCRLSSPYNANFAGAAKRLGGKWDGDSSTWVFDIRDEARVRELTAKYYGSDGLTDDVVSLRVKFAAEDYGSRGPYITPSTGGYWRRLSGAIAERSSATA